MCQPPAIMKHRNDEFDKKINMLIYACKCKMDTAHIEVLESTGACKGAFWS